MLDSNSQQTTTFKLNKLALGAVQLLRNAPGGGGVGRVWHFVTGGGGGVGRALRNA